MRRPPPGSAGQALLLAFVLYAALAAGFLALNVPPLQNPDETNHLRRADNIARGYLLGHRFGGGDAGGIASPEIDLVRQAFDFPQSNPDQRLTSAMFGAGAQKFGRSGAEVSFPNTAIYPPVFYAPSVLAVWIGKAGRMSIVQTVYLARLLTALVSGGMVAAAIRICVGAGVLGAATPIFAVATLPMSLALQSACSQDGPLLGATALAAALFARLRADRASAGFGAMCFCLALVASARPPYAAFALLPAAASVDRRARIWGTALVVAAGLGWAGLAQHVAGTEYAFRGVGVQAQAKLLLDPLFDLRLVADTLRSNGWEYWTEIVGKLGWLDVELPPWLVGSALVLLLVAAAASFDLRRPGAAYVCLAAALSALAVLLSIYVTWNRPGAVIIEGVQGRYFLPPLLVLAGLGAVGRTIPQVAAVLAVGAFPAVSIAVTMREVVLRYYLAP